MGEHKSANLLVQKALLIQLSDDGDLDEAYECLREAIEVDPVYLPALIEMAYFAYYINDDEKEAQKYTERASKVCSDYLNQVVELVANISQEG